MKVMLVNPRALNEAAVGVGIPIGLSTLAATVEQAGHSVGFVDAPILELDTPATVARVMEWKPDVVGLTAMTAVYPAAREVAAALREAGYGGRIVIGGPHVTFTAEQALREEPAFDVVVRGEADDSLLELLAAFDARASVKDIAGVSVRENGHVHHAPARVAPKDITKYPAPAYHLLPMEAYRERQAGAFGETFSPVRLLASRGCPWSCQFCSVPAVSGKAYRQKGAAGIVDEVARLHRDHGITSFKFADDSLGVVRRHVLDIAAGIRALDMPLKWECETRLDLLDDEILSALAGAGCRGIWVGIEAGNEATLKRISKGLKYEKIPGQVKRIQDHGLRVSGFFITGLPYESEAGHAENVRFACDLALDMAVFSVLTPFPGTEYWDRPEQHGLRIRTRNFSHYTESEAVIDTSELSAEDINRINWQSYLRFYMRPDYVTARQPDFRFGVTKFVLGFVERLMQVEVPEPVGVA